MHITLFGGAFDPPHVGHVHVVKNFLSLNLSDQIAFLPVGEHAFSKKMASAQHRLEMLSLLCKDHFSSDEVIISDHEVTQSGMSITHQTLEELSSAHPQNKYSFLMGSDNLKNFHKWHNYQEMLDKYTFFVYPRLGFDFSGLRKGMVALEDMPAVKISSTDVKLALANHDEVGLEKMLSPQILNYINNHSLYENKHNPGSKKN